MNVRELSIYIGNYLLNTYYSKALPFLIISMVVFILFVILHYFRYHSLKKVSAGLWIFSALLSMEIATLIVTMLVREPIETTIRWRIQPFSSYIMVVEEKSMGMLAQIIMNFIVYIPFGCLLPSCFDVLKKGRYVILITVLCSGGVELIQRLWGIGVFETDDILNNVLGALVGFMVHRLTVLKREKT